MNPALATQILIFIKVLVQMGQDLITRILELTPVSGVEK